MPPRRSTGNPARALARGAHLLKTTVRGCLISERFSIPTVAIPRREFSGDVPAYKIRDARPSRPGWTAPSSNTDQTPTVAVVRAPITIDEEA